VEREKGPNYIEGDLTATGRSFGIVASRFNDFIVKELLGGALDAIKRHGGDLGAVDVVWVPGSYEVPLAVKRLALSGRYDAVIALGAVIRGATAHFDYVAGGVASGISAVALETNLPVVFGVITTETIEQAIASGGDYDTRYRIRWPDGSVHWIMARGRVLRHGAEALAEAVELAQLVGAEQLGAQPHGFGDRLDYGE
jgi:6,7-dimethyl-8-ribityllumazine synthase